MINPMRLALFSVLLLSACVTTVAKDRPKTLLVADMIREKLTEKPDDQAVNTAAILTRPLLAGISDPLIRTFSEKTESYSLLYVDRRNGDAVTWRSPDNSLLGTVSQPSSDTGKWFDMLNATKAMPSP